MALSVCPVALAIVKLMGSLIDAQPAALSSGWVRGVGGGCKEMGRRFGTDVEDLFATLQRGLMSDNALQARHWRFIDEADPVHLDEDRLLAPAFERARAIASDGGHGLWSRCCRLARSRTAHSCFPSS